MRPSQLSNKKIVLICRYKSGTRISAIPDAISGLTSLAFLDLAQNRLRDLEPAQFTQLHSLTALNLERNLLQSISASAFHGVNDTLSSISLLNNLITHFPKEALKSLRELRVRMLRIL
jgi:Leucine-rich repeat (LRR) protein